MEGHRNDHVVYRLSSGWSHIIDKPEISLAAIVASLGSDVVKLLHGLLSLVERLFLFLHTHVLLIYKSLSIHYFGLS